MAEKQGKISRKPRKLSKVETRNITETLSRILVSLSSDVFKRRTSIGSGRFALLSRDFDQIFGQIVSIRIKTLDNKIW